MNVGICSWAFADILRRNRPLRELACLALDAGFTSIEGTFHPRGELNASSPPVKTPLAVPVNSLATLQLHRFHLTDPRPERRACALKTIEEMSQCAGLWKIPSISLSPGPLYPNQELDKFLEEITPPLRSLITGAAQLGSRVALENVPGHCLATRTGMARMLNELGPHAYVCLDIGNALLDPPISRWLEEFRSRIIKVHLSDGRIGEGILRPALPGQGDVRWQEVRDEIERLPSPPAVFVEAPLPRGMLEAAFHTDLSAAVRNVWQ